jgi:hypothetical protein
MSPSRRDLLLGSGAAAAMVAAAAPVSAQAEAAAGLSITPQTFGARGDGRTDDTQSLQAALDAALERGTPLFIPAGRYRVTRPLMVRPRHFYPHAPFLGAGPRVTGAGAMLTELIADFGAGALLDVGVDADFAREYKAIDGATFTGFAILGAGGGASGIRLQGASRCRMTDLLFANLRGNGLQIVCEHGDNDASNMIRLERVRFDTIAGWGLDAMAGPGMNEISFLSLAQVFFHGCGRAGPGLQSGAMRWKGQVCSLDQCAFTENRNVALFVPGAAGLAQTLTIRDTAFENNEDRHLVCTGITGFRASGIQIYSNDAVRARSGLLFDASHHVVRGVDVNGAVVRATAGNGDFTAFAAQGGNLDVGNRVRNVVWENFDHPGQRRFDGFLFDDVRQCCALRLVSRTEIAFGPDPSAPRGNRSPLRLRGGGGGAPSATGEWVEAAILSDLVLSSDAMAPGRTWWIYLYDDNGRMRLEASPVAPVPDRSSGYPVRPDDPARLAVGSVRTDASGSFESVS